MPVDKDMLLGVLRPVVLGNGTWTVPHRRLCDCAVKFYVAFAFSQSHIHRRRMHSPQEIAVSHPILMSLMETLRNLRRGDFCPCQPENYSSHSAFARVN
jgi:hypothetical protein